MTNERDALERLRAADPARGASYQHADVDALLSRVMTAAAPDASAPPAFSLVRHAAEGGAGHQPRVPGPVLAAGSRGARPGCR